MIGAMVARSAGSFAAYDQARIVAQINVDWFFDRLRVQAACDKAMLVSLTKAGKIVRDKTKQGIKRKGLARTRQLTSAAGRRRQQQEVVQRPASPPGTPPFTHTGFFRKWIGYAYDPSRRSVVIGSLKAHWLYDLHEFGGINMHARNRGHYPARPAFEIGLRRSLPFLRDYIPVEFANSIRLNGRAAVL
jgi:hypothetical protein